MCLYHYLSQSTARAFVGQGTGQAVQVADGAGADHRPDYGPRALSLLARGSQFSYRSPGDASFFERGGGPIPRVTVFTLENLRECPFSGRSHVA
jgi:hypothetical protein